MLSSCRSCCAAVVSDVAGSALVDFYAKAGINEFYLFHGCGHSL